MTPNVSILMSAFNAENFLREAIDDLLGQTFTDFEFVIINDASTDCTADIIDSYAAKDTRIVPVRNETNLGLTASLNKGLELCRAPLIARADADDRYMKNRLEKQVAFMHRHTDVGLLSSAAEVVAEDGRRLFVRQHPTDDGALRIRELFLNSFLHPAAMYRAELVRRVGGYDCNFRTAQDSDLWIRLRKLTKAANLSEPLIQYRYHSQQVTKTRSMNERQAHLSVRQRALSDYLNRPISIGETCDMNSLFYANKAKPLRRENFAKTMANYREILAIALLQETKETCKYFRNETSRALIETARLIRGDPIYKVRLVAEAARWNGKGMTNSAAEKLLKRLRKY